MGLVHVSSQRRDHLGRDHESRRPCWVAGWGWVAAFPVFSLGAELPRPSGRACALRSPGTGLEAASRLVTPDCPAAWPPGLSAVRGPFPFSSAS